MEKDHYDLSWKKQYSEKILQIYDKETENDNI